MLVEDLSLHTLRTQGYATLRYPEELKKRAARVMESWKAFLAIPDDVRNRFPYLPDTGNSGSGYEPPDSKKRDYKHVFHAKLLDKEWLRETAQSLNHPAAVRFVDDALGFITEIKPLIASFASDMERAFDVGNFREDFLADIDEGIFRLLYYPPRAIGTEFAVPHPDKGGFTLHTGESHPGVERLTHDGRWVPFPVKEGEALVFAGMRLQHRTKGAVKALWHRVLALKGTAEEGRYASVFFANFRGTPYYDKKRLGSTQGLESGFNYRMSRHEFEKLFAE